MTAASVELLADSSQIRKAALDLEKLQAQGAPVERASDQVAKAANKANKSIGKLGRSTGMAGIQIQQFVGQIQGGQSALLAFSQQSADLGFVLGAPLAGAVIGIGASLASFLIPNLIGASTNVEELRDRIEDLGDTAQKTVAQIKFLAQENEDAVNKLSKRNEEIANQIQKRIELIEKASSEGTGLREGQFAVPLSAARNLEIYAGFITKTERELKVLRAELDTNNQEIIKLNQETADLTKKKQDLRGKTQSLTVSLQAQIVALESGAQAAEVYAATQRAIANGTQEQLPAIIELINRKYELADAQRAAAMAARKQAAEQKALDSMAAQMAANAERQAQAERARLEQVAGGNLGLTRLQALEQQYAREKQLLEEAQAAGIQSEISYQERLKTLREQYSEQAAQIQNDSLELVNWESFGNRASGALAAVTLGFADGKDMARQLAASVLTEALGALIQFGVKSAATYAADALGFTAAQSAKTAAVTASSAAQATAGVAALGTVTAAAATSGATIAASMAPAAAATSIATAGAAPAAALPISLSTIAAIIGALVVGGAVFGRATGGQVMGGRPYLVGERGPELFTPNASGSGRITPFNQLMNEARQSSGDTTATSVVNINLANGEEFRRPESRRQVEAAAYRGMMKAYRRNS